MSDSVKRDPKACLTPYFTLVWTVRTPFAESRIMTWRPAVVQSRFYPWGRRYRADSENTNPSKLTSSIRM